MDPTFLVGIGPMSSDEITSTPGSASTAPPTLSAQESAGSTELWWRPFTRRSSMVARQLMAGSSCRANPATTPRVPHRAKRRRDEPPGPGSDRQKGGSGYTYCEQTRVTGPGRNRVPQDPADQGFQVLRGCSHLSLGTGSRWSSAPTGSGKSNVVRRAISLGAQGPGAPQRSGSQKMDDVIFVGTQTAQLGRAEVSLTIDNSAGLLPIEFTEVTITRLLFRSGDSEYAINGVPCRLLDIQGSSSPDGVGRQQHVIISAGNIDGVLNARPGAPPHHRRGGGRGEVPPPQGAGRTSSAGHRGQPDPDQRPAPRGPSAAASARASGRRRSTPREPGLELTALRVHLAGRELVRWKGPARGVRPDPVRSAGRGPEAPGHPGRPRPSDPGCWRPSCRPWAVDVGDLLVRYRRVSEKAQGQVAAGRTALQPRARARIVPSARR